MAMSACKYASVPVILCFILCYTAGAPASPPEGVSRDRRFGPMGGGGGGGGSPFHSMGGMTGGMAAMGGMGPMGGGMGMMHGPRAPGTMSPAMGGPGMKGQGAAMFNPAGSACIRKDIVCPQWCLVVDSNGCKKCPCGPAGGMATVAGGSAVNPMGGHMSAMHGGGGGGGGGVGPMGGAMGGMTATQTGPSTSGGGSSNSASSSSTSSSSATSGTFTGTGSASSVSTTNNIYQIGTAGTAGYEKPVKECAGTLLCASTCNGYQLGATTSDGCKSCVCPSSHTVSTSTIHYITTNVKPATRECTVTAHCMQTCHNGYTMTTTDGYGCPKCQCMEVIGVKPPTYTGSSEYQYPIEIAVEPPGNQHTGTNEYQYPIEIAIEPPRYQQPSYVTCPATSCASGCSVGFKCGRNGCPTCECIHPSVVGITEIHQMHVGRPVTCSRALACPASCRVGYKCGIDGCPTCKCLVSVTPSYVQTRPQYTAQTCTHTLTCAATCVHGYQLVTDGTGSCGKCVCKQQTIFAIQRPQPQYQIVRCPSTSSCGAKCSHGYTVIKHQGSCPTCQCKPGSNGCTGGCQEKGTNIMYVTGGSSQGTSYIGSGSGSSSTSYILTSAGSGSGTSYVTGTDGGSRGGTSYVLSSGGSSDTGSSGGASYQLMGSSSCPPLPPDCQPSCIKYDDPHCRRCVCETSYVRYLSGKK